MAATFFAVHKVGWSFKSPFVIDTGQAGELDLLACPPNLARKLFREAYADSEFREMSRAHLLRHPEATLAGSGFAFQQVRQVLHSKGKLALSSREQYVLRSFLTGRLATPSVMNSMIRLVYSVGEKMTSIIESGATMTSRAMQT